MIPIQQWCTCHNRQQSSYNDHGINRDVECGDHSFNNGGRNDNDKCSNLTVVVSMGAFTMLCFIFTYLLLCGDV